MRRAFRQNDVRNRQHFATALKQRNSFAGMLRCAGAFGGLMDYVNAQLVVEIQEVDATKAVPSNTFDDDGNVTGENPDYEKQLEAVKDMTFFHVQIIFNGQKREMVTPVVRHDTREWAVRKILRDAAKGIAAKVITPTNGTNGSEEKIIALT